MREEQSVVRSERLEFVRRGAERQRGEGGDLRRERFGEAPFGVEPGANRRAALGKPVKSRKRRFEPFEPEFELRRIARKFLSERHRRRVPQVGAA